MKGQICESCKGKDEDCYCSPNSTCDGYREDTTLKTSNLIRIMENDNFIIEYDRERRMYRVSYFEDNHFVDECWFDAYREK